MDLYEKLEALSSQLEQRLSEFVDLKTNLEEELENVRIEFLGRKGKLADIMSHLPELSPEERPKLGQLANKVKEKVSSLVDEHKKGILLKKEQAKLANFDPTLPANLPSSGSLHPITQVMQEVCDIFIKMGYEIASGPEIETDFHNFEALNLPPNHPARDMQDTFYIKEDKLVLRTHTSPIQARTMLSQKPPVAIIAPGKVYRKDSDITHTPMFHQIEGLLVDKNVSMADLRGTLTLFMRSVFGKDTKVRFRPSFFPFTEPSAEADISCTACKGSGRIGTEPCRICKGTGWLEILGCGMVNVAVFEKIGYDPELYTGFAFGLGLERIAMLKYGINDLRLNFENDLRFLRQFGI